MKIAHLSDIHILDARTGTRQARYKLATKFVSLGRAIDPKIRARNLSHALGLAKANRADHIVISGDLTEVGEEVEYEYFAEVLHDARLPADSVTLVPGNHDAYTEGSWRRALEGPLRPFARASTGGSKDDAGKVVEREGVALLPVDTSIFQSIAWSGGIFTRAMFDAIDRRLKDSAFRDKAVALVVHHPPFHPHRLPIVRWIDGLRGRAEVLDLLSRHPRLQLLHGHLHRVLDRIVTTATSTSKSRISKLEGDGHNSQDNSQDLTTKTKERPLQTRLFGAPATCDSARIRLYDVRDGILRAA